MFKCVGEEKYWITIITQKYPRASYLGTNYKQYGKEKQIKEAKETLNSLTKSLTLV